MAVYTIFLILADLRLFSVSAAFGHMSKSVTGWIIDGADLSVIAGTLSISVSVLILIFAVVFLFFCIACVILTVLSYWLIRRKKYKADAWMKIVVFGFALSQTRFVLDFHSVYTAGCTFNNCGFSRRVVFFDLFVYSKTKARPYSRTLKYIGQFLTASSI